MWRMTWQALSVRPYQSGDPAPRRRRPRHNRVGATTEGREAGGRSGTARALPREAARPHHTRSPALAQGSGTVLSRGFNGTPHRHLSEPCHLRACAVAAYRLGCGGTRSHGGIHDHLRIGLLSRTQGCA